MPLFYSLEGFPSPYELPPLAPVGAAFSSVLSREMNSVGLSDAREGTPQREVAKGVRGYGAPAPVHVRAPVLIAEQVMTAPAVCIISSLLLSSVREKMQRKGFRHLPVVSKESKLIGIISDRDVLRAPTPQDESVLLHMTSKVLTATPETPIRQIAEAMLQHRIGALPVVDGDHQVIGIITTTDILKAVVNRAPIELWA